MAGTLTVEVEPDDAALRAERRARALAEMEADGIDILILGREGNARYVAGAPRLWTAGSRPFTPGCILVRATGDVHLLTTWDEGIPDDIPREHLYGISFNPMNMVKVLQGLAGASTAATVGTDSLTPMFSQLLPMAFPAATIVDGEAAMRRARRIKTAAEVEEIRASVALAERCLAAAERRLAPGVTERRLAPGVTERLLTGAFMTEMAEAGVTTPSSQDVGWITPPELPWRRHRDVPVADGDVVVLSGGVIRGGYAGELARTHDVGGQHRALLEEAADLRGRLLEACRPGEPTSVLLDVYAKADVAPPPAPIARGLGLGFDLPIVTASLPETAAAETLDPGLALALTAFVWEPGVGAAITTEPLLITDNGPITLKSEP